MTRRARKHIKIDDISVEPVHVDHSIPAAYGFIIRTSDSTIVYTGDLRLHGPRKDLTEDFLEKAKEAKPDTLICEGTRMTLEEKRKNYSEEQVEQISDSVTSSTRKIIFLARYSRDLDRFRSFYNTAKKNERKIVITPKSAYLLSKVLKDEHLRLPDPMKDDSILVYYKRKMSGKYDDRDYLPWEREFMNKMVNCSFIHNEQSKLVMDLDFHQLGELIDIRPDVGSHFIRSMSEPFSEEDIEDEVLHNWLEHFGLRFHQLHASGHLSRDQITSLVTKIAARKVIPIHTEDALLFKQSCDNIEIPKREK